MFNQSPSLKVYLVQLFTEIILYSFIARYGGSFLRGT
jgi:hypothetical protein